jgi:hypothetical protein
MYLNIRFLRRFAFKKDIEFLRLFLKGQRAQKNWVFAELFSKKLQKAPNNPPQPSVRYHSHPQLQHLPQYEHLPLA